MKALVYHGSEDLRLEEIADLKPSFGEALVRVKACGICGSDVHGYLGITGRRIPPMVMGHEFSGEVADVGGGVTHIQVGDRVAVYPVIFCGQCKQCSQGNEHLCLNKKSLGVLECNGAMAEYVSVPEKLLFKLADHVTYDVGSMIEPLAVSCHAVNHAGNLAGKNVLVVGAGTIGLLVTALIKMNNPARIFVSDLSDLRLGIARKMGATRGINPSLDNLTEIIRDETGALGVDVAFEAVGATPTVQQAMASLKDRGKAVWIGNSAKMIQVNMQEIVTKELQVIGTFLYSLKEFGYVASLLNEGKLNIEPVISLKVPMMERGIELFNKLAKDPGSLIKVILNN